MENRTIEDENTGLQETLAEIKRLNASLEKRLLTIKNFGKKASDFAALVCKIKNSSNR